MPTTLENIKDRTYIASRWLVENLGFLNGLPGLAVQIYSKNQRAREPYDMHKVGECETGQCAAWSNKQLRDSGYKNSYGNAWNQTGKTYVDGYKYVNRPTEFSYPAIIKYNADAADSLKQHLDTLSLNKDKPYIANMYYNDSPYAREAFQDGTGGSHVGLLKYDKCSKTWFVEHNYHGDIMKDSLKDLLGSKYNIGVTRIYTPRKKLGGIIKKKRFNDGYVGR